MKVLLATGGSGGHIFPAIKTALYLKREGHEIFFAGALQSAVQRLDTLGLTYEILDVEGFSIKSSPRFLMRMIKAVAQSRKLLKRVQPDKVIGFGSYSSFPVLWAAKNLKIPTMVHEQNVIPGKANRLSARFADRIAVSFAETQKAFPGSKVVITGCPCNDEKPKGSKLEILRSFGLQENRVTILVLGGSQGSQYLNQIVFESMSDLPEAQVIHMTGVSDEVQYAQKYSQTKVPCYVRAFLDPVERAYAIADVVIARAGAATVSELASFGLPSVLVPYPFAHSHQTANAKVLKDAGVAVVIEQKDLSRQALVEAVRRMVMQNLTPEAVRGKLRGIVVENPTQELARAIMSLK